MNVISWVNIWFHYRFVLSKENGSKDNIDSFFMIDPVSPINNTSIAVFWFVSYSDKVCLQAPQGPTGSFIVLVSDFR